MCKKTALRALALFCLLLCPALHAGPVWSATINYPDDGTALVNHPIFSGLSLFPGTSLSGNSVTVDALNGAASPTNVFGGLSDGAGTAENNRVFIKGGTVGAGADGHVYGGYSITGAATGNSVSITGGTIGTSGNNSLVVGGLTDSGSATNNTVTLAGNPDLRQAAVYGGCDNDSSTPDDVFTGNTLNVLGYSGTVRGVQNFQNYNFVLPNSLGNGGTLIGITDAGLAANRMNETGIAIPGIQGGGARAPARRRGGAAEQNRRQRRSERVQQRAQGLLAVL